MQLGKESSCFRVMTIIYKVAIVLYMGNGISSSLIGHCIGQQATVDYKQSERSKNHDVILPFSFFTIGRITSSVS